MAIQQQTPASAASEHGTYNFRAAAVIGWGLVVLIRIVTAPHGTKPASS